MINTIYRAKEVDAYNWVYGYHIEVNNKHFICDVSSIEIERIKDNTYSLCSNNVIEVDVKTLGQAIGYMDSHGNNIFVGDIVKFGDSYTALVWFNNEMQCLDSIYINRHFSFNGTDYLNDTTNDYAAFCFMLQDPWGDFPGKIKVIGNIFDNSYLIENCEDLSVTYNVIEK